MIYDNEKCTACNINWFRLDFSNFNNSCPCKEGYFDDGNRKCIKCYVGCATCSE